MVLLCNKENIFSETVIVRLFTWFSLYHFNWKINTGVLGEPYKSYENILLKYLYTKKWRTSYLFYIVAESVSPKQKIQYAKTILGC